MCMHITKRKHGFDRRGQQRWRCMRCGVSWSERDSEPRMNTISIEKEAEIRKRLAEGQSVRQIAAAVGVTKCTVLKRRKQDEAPPKASRVSQDQCDWCGGHLAVKKEFHRRTRRTSHKFCGQACYQAFYAERRSRRTCGMCGRKILRGEAQVRTCCPTCYGILQQHGYDWESADTARLLLQLKKEIRHAEWN